MKPLVADCCGVQTARFNEFASPVEASNSSSNEHVQLLPSAFGGNVSPPQLGEAVPPDVEVVGVLAGLVVVVVVEVGGGVFVAVVVVVVVVCGGGVVVVAAVGGGVGVVVVMTTGGEICLAWVLPTPKIPSTSTTSNDVIPTEIVRTPTSRS